MRIAHRIVFDRAQAEALRGVIGRLLQPAIVEHQPFGLAVFQKQLAIISAVEPAGHFAPYLITIEAGAVEEGGGCEVHESVRCKGARGQL